MDRDIRVLTLAALATTILTPILAAAQAPPQIQAPIAPKSDQLDTKELDTKELDTKACANGRATVGQGGDLDMQKPAGRTLSDHLARSDGVICPPDQVDPEMKQPTPPGGSMPVIPPPGSPGGDPNTHPK